MVDESSLPSGGRKGEVKGTFWMHYVEGNVGDKEFGFRVNTAACNDGFNWVKSRRNVMEPTKGGPDGGGVGSVNVVKSMKWDEEGRVWRNEAGFTMYYSARDGEGKQTICEATNGSPTLAEEWVKKGTVELPFESVGGPNVIRLPGGEERMYFHVNGEDGRRWIEAADKKGGEWVGIAKLPLPQI